MWILALAVAWAECMPEQTFEHEGTRVHIATCPGAHLTIVAPDGRKILEREWNELLTPVERAQVLRAEALTVTPQLEEGSLTLQFQASDYETTIHLRLEDGTRTHGASSISIPSYEALLAGFIDGSLPYDHVGLLVWSGAPPIPAEQGLRIDKGTSRACMLQATGSQCVKRGLLGTRPAGRSYLDPSFRTLLKGAPALQTRLAHKDREDRAEAGAFGIRLTYGVNTPHGVAAWTWEARGDDPELRRLHGRLLRFAGL